MPIKSLAAISGAAILFFALAGGLAWFVSRLVRGNQKSVLASLPFLREQEVNIDTSGSVVVLLEVPRLARDFRDFEIELTERRNGNRAVLRHNYLAPRAKISGVSTVKIPYGGISLGEPGPVSVKIMNYREGADYSSYRLVFSRPFAARLVFQIVGIVFCGVGMLLCLLGACWVAGILK